MDDAKASEKREKDRLRQAAWRANKKAKRERETKRKQVQRAKKKEEAKKKEKEEMSLQKFNDNSDIGNGGGQDDSFGSIDSAEANQMLQAIAEIQTQQNDAIQEVGRQVQTRQNEAIQQAGRQAIRASCRVIKSASKTKKRRKALLQGSNDDKVAPRALVDA